MLREKADYRIGGWLAQGGTRCELVLYGDCVRDGAQPWIFW